LHRRVRPNAPQLLDDEAENVDDVVDERQRLVAVTFAAEIGDVHRFDTPRQLMQGGLDEG
jgi:hypothetical protein